MFSVCIFEGEDANLSTGSTDTEDPTPRVPQHLLACPKSHPSGAAEGRMTLDTYF